MELPEIVVELENKEVSVRELARYFGLGSVEELILTLRRLARNDELKFVVTLSADYFEWERSKQNVEIRADVLKPVDPFGVLQRDTYGLNVKAETPLSETEIIELVKKLPPEAVPRYLRFKLSNINHDKLHKVFEAAQKARDTDKDEFYEYVEYRGLAVDGSQVSYKGKPIILGTQQRQAVRLLVERQGRPCSKNDFTDEVAQIFSGDNYPNGVDGALRTLIYELRKKLEPKLGKGCILNIPKTGWFLNLKP